MGFVTGLLNFVPSRCSSRNYPEGCFAKILTRRLGFLRPLAFWCRGIEAQKIGQKLLNRRIFQKCFLLTLPQARLLVSSDLHSLRVLRRALHLGYQRETLEHLCRGEIL